MEFDPFELFKDESEIKSELRIIVKDISPDLEPIKREDSSKEVYLVQKSKCGLYILKEAPIGYNEIKALKIAKNVKGITHLVETYYGEWILKEYVPGRTFYNYEENYGKLPPKRLRPKLSAIVKRLHKQGIVNLDIHPDNTVITKEGKELTIVDFDGCSFRENLSETKFKELMERDHKNVEKAFTENIYKPHQTLGPDSNEVADFDYLFE
jgi:serine/threonine protein kinase